MMSRPMLRESIDFLLIGSQKAGTTSLFAHLSEHPKIYMPREKEVNFFAVPELFARGARWYLDEYFSAAPPGAVVGEASPRYLLVTEAAARIRQTFPGVRLIAILRNPIDRAFSHYQMARKKGAEARSFEDAVSDLMPRPDPVDPVATELVEYLAFSRYARLLAPYFERFPAEQIRVEFLEDLERDPEACMKRLYSFVGADPEFVPRNVRRVHNRSGSYRFARIDRALRTFTNRPPLGLLIPYRARQRFYLWLELHNTRPRRFAGPAAPVRERLAEHFREDVAQLEVLLGRRSPWREFHSNAGG